MRFFRLAPWQNFLRSWLFAWTSAVAAPLQRLQPTAQLPLSPVVSPRGLSPLGSAVGSGLAMASLFLVSHTFVGRAPNELLVASMGASAVLMFCVPQGELSSPWAVFGGHLLSALIGVSACLLIPLTPLAATVAVGGAIFVMLLFKCLHPPGGATALSAVTGGGGAALGYEYVLTPVLLNVLIMLGVAYLFHLPGRRYPLPRSVRRFQERGTTP